MGRYRKCNVIIIIITIIISIIITFFLPVYALYVWLSGKVMFSPNSSGSGNS